MGNHGSQFLYEGRKQGGMIGSDSAFLPARSQAPLGGGVKVSDMIGEDIQVSPAGEVTGTIHYVSEMPQYEGDQAKGHYFPIQFTKQMYKKLHVGGSVVDGQFVSGKDITPSGADPYLVIRVENCTDKNSVSVFDYETKTQLFKLDFSKATQDPAPGRPLSAKKVLKKG